MDAAHISRMEKGRLAAVIEAAVDGMIAIDEAGIVMMYSPSCERLFGYSAGEVVGQNIKLLMPEPYHGEHDGYLANYMKTGEKKIIGIGREVVGRRKDGSTFPINLSVGEFTESGNPGFVGIVHDLTDQKREEAHNRRLARIVEQSVNEIFLFDAETLLFQTVNASARKNLGYSEEELSSMIAGEIGPEFTAESFIRLLQPLRDGTESMLTFTSVHERKDGSRYDVEVHLQLMAEENPPVFAAIVKDITEVGKAQEALAELQSELNHATRLTAANEMAAALAHELNQPLTAIVNYAEACRTLLEADSAGNKEKISEYISRAAEQSHRAGEIIRHLREFTEKGETEQRPENISEVVQEACDLFLRDAPDRGVTVITEYGEDLSVVMMDRIQIQQVVTNLVRNAIDAMVEMPTKRLTIKTSTDENGGVVVSVADTGPGLSDEVAGKLFKPFTTTKSTGMGMGLSISQSIIEAHGGEIEAAPNEAGGVTFSFTLPRIRSK